MARIKSSKDTTSFLPRRIREAADSLEVAFLWEDTAYGQDYWEKVRNRLIALAEEAEQNGSK